MPAFFHIFAPDVALRTLLERLQRRVEPEMVPTSQAPGRVTAEAVRVPEALPPFPRPSMNGYAVRARDTFGASESLPAYLVLRRNCCASLAQGNALCTRMIQL
ncbi:MAG TPA: hypothetical protein VI542_01125 [Candidatus Tectomicrobia bacterium]